MKFLNYDGPGVLGLLAKLGLVVGVLSSLYGCEFEADFAPLEFPTVPPQPFSQNSNEFFAPEMEDLPDEQSRARSGFGDLSSEEAITLCGGREYFGDESMGSCLAPGGDSYFVWVGSDQVMLVDRSDPYLQAFRFAALHRTAEQANVDRLASQWPELALLGVEALAVGVTCGGAIASGATGIGLLWAGILAGGCAGSFGAFLWTGAGVARDAQDYVESVFAIGTHETDANYNFCRMQGGSDAECIAQG